MAHFLVFWVIFKIIIISSWFTELNLSESWEPKLRHGFFHIGSIIGFGVLETWLNMGISRLAPLLFVRPKATLDFCFCVCFPPGTCRLQHTFFSLSFLALRDFSHLLKSLAMFSKVSCCYEWAFIVFSPPFHCSTLLRNHILYPWMRWPVGLGI